MTKYIPDCYWPETDNGAYVSHEAVCVLNTNASPATVNLTLFFEDRPKMAGFSVTVDAPQPYPSGQAQKRRRRIHSKRRSLCHDD